MQVLQIPERLFTAIIPAGTLVGTLQSPRCEGLTESPVWVIAMCGHDTQSAVAAVQAPADEKDVVFISCGTWSLFGTERNEPLVSPEAAARNITNKIGYGGKIHFLKSCTGLWLIQESGR